MQIGEGAVQEPVGVLASYLSYSQFDISERGLAVKAINALAVTVGMAAPRIPLAGFLIKSPGNWLGFPSLLFFICLGTCRMR